MLGLRRRRRRSEEIGESEVTACTYSEEVTSVSVWQEYSQRPCSSDCDFDISNADACRIE